MHLQRNATQRIPQLYLNNNFKFYIFQFFRAVNFLSVSFLSFVKESKSSCSFFVEKKNHAKGGQSSKTISFCQKEDKARLKSPQSEACFQRKTTPFRIHNSVFMGLLQFIENQFAIFNYAFFCALKNKFEIISQLNYGFCYKNYFFNLNQVFRNSYDFGERFGRNLNYGFEKNYNFGFGKNYFGDCNFGFDFGNEIYGI